MKKKSLGTIAGAALAGLLTQTSLANMEVKVTDGHACQNNACAGKSSCMGFGNDSCGGKNGCAGKGWLNETSKESCEAKAKDKAGKEVAKGKWVKAPAKKEEHKK